MSYSGGVYTVDGTQVNVYDGLGIQADTMGWKFEAEWTPNGHVRQLAGDAGLAFGPLPAGADFGAALLACTRRPSTKTSSRRITLVCQPGWSCR